jgi:ATP-dependent 26S proteasome regulatory subunit
MDQAGIQDYVKQLSLTGNAVADTFIITSLFSVALTYFNIITGMIQGFFQKVWSVLLSVLKYWIKSKVSGRTLCVIEIQKSNVLYNVLYPIFSDYRYKSDENIKSKFISFFDYLDNVSQENKSDDRNNKRTYEYSYHEYYKYHDKKFDIATDYKSDKTFDFNKKLGFDNVKRKIFKHGNYFIKMTLREWKNNSEWDEMEIELLSYDANKTTEEQNIALIEDFLVTKFNITESIYYTYEIDNDDKYFYKHISKLIKQVSDRGGGLLRYGNGFSTKINSKQSKQNENNYVCRNVNITMTDHDFSKENKDYKKEIQLFENDFASNQNNDRRNNNNRNGDSTFFHFYYKYVSQNNFNYDYNPVYMIDDNKIYFFILFNNNTKIIIVSFGKRMTSDLIKEKMDWLIKLAIKDSNGIDIKEKNEVYINRRDNKQWNQFRLDKRSFDTIYLPDSQMVAIKEEIENFMKMEKLYREFQIPYKKGILFYGPPGTGKTSVVKSIAYEYQMNIYLVNINSEEVNDETIVDILNSLGGDSNKILLFEDIDTAFADKEKMRDEMKIDVVTEPTTKRSTMPTITTTSTTTSVTGTEKTADTGYDAIKKLLDNNNKNNQPKVEKKYLTYSGLLNALDGVLSNQNGVITIMTTNYIDKLGDAFLRPGRIDKKFELKECNSEQIAKMINTLLKKKMKIDLNYKKSLDKSSDSDNSNNNDSDDDSDDCVNSSVHHKNQKKQLKENNYDEEYEKFKMDINLNKRINDFVGRLCDENGQSKIKPCEMQFYILKYITDVDNIFNNYEELLRKN